MAAVLGLVVMGGWTFDIPLLRSVLPGAVQMKANAAVALILAGCALFMFGGQPSLARQRLAQGLALVVAALGSITLAEYVFGWQLGIDELLFRDTANAHNLIRGRMSPYSAVAFVNIGLALAAVPQRALRWLVCLAAGSVVIIGAVSLLGYLWNASELVTDQLLPPVALNTALAFCLLGVGTLLVARNSATQRESNRTTLSAVETKILAGFIGAFLLLIAGGGYTYRSSVEFTKAALWVDHTQQVRTALGQLYATVSNAETAQRNYLITGIRQHFDSYVGQINKANDQQDVVAHLIADNPVQVQNMMELRQLILIKYELLARGITLYERNGFVAARDLIASGEGINTMQSILTLSNHMDKVEENLLQERNAAFTRAHQSTLVSLLLTLAIATGLFIILFNGIRKEMMAREQTEQALGASERYNRGIVENSPDCLQLLTLDARLTYMTERGCQLLEVNDFCSIENAEWLNFWKGTDHDSARHAVEVAVTGVIGQFQAFCATFKGTPKWWDVVVAPIMGANGKPDQLLAVSRDITESKPAETEIKALNASLQQRATELEAANKELESFSYSVSHDLRAPLRHIDGYLDMLAADTKDQLADEPRRYLKVIADASTQMGQLIDDLLAFSRMARTGMHETRIELDAMVRESIAKLEMVTRDRNIEWKLAPLPSAIGDPAMLRQVFSNLLGNAVKYTRPRDPARIEIGVAGEEDGRNILFLRDNGVGFDMKYAGKLFGVFQRLHRVDEFEGTGIGLANVRRIITRHGGRVWAEAAPDQGATFYFTLKS